MGEFWTNFWMSVVAGVISGVIVSGAFYVLAIRGQKRDMALLRNLHRITIQALENAKYIEVTRDSQGNPIGIKFRFEAGTGVFPTTGSTSEMAVQPQRGGHGRDGTWRTSGLLNLPIRLCHRRKTQDDGSGNTGKARQARPGTPTDCSEANSVRFR